MNYRIYEMPEKLEEMTGHAGHCVHCGGPYVKMLRNGNFELQIDHCVCFSCGQRYYMEIEDVDKWEFEQWKQEKKIP